MKYAINISEKAEFDIEQTYKYIADILLSPDTAANQIRRIEHMINSLETMPERYPIYPKDPWKSRELRCVPIDNYVIFYIPDKSAKIVTIIRILYCKSNLEKIK